MPLVITAAALFVIGDHIKANKDGDTDSTCLKMSHGSVRRSCAHAGLVNGCLLSTVYRPRQIPPFYGDGVAIRRTNGGAHATVSS